MNTELLNKTIALDNECDRFMTAFNPDSLPRVVERGLKPVLGGVADILTFSGLPLGMVDIKQVNVGHDKTIEGVVHIGVTQHGDLMTLVVSPDGTRVFGPPRKTTFEELVALGVTGLELVKGAKDFAQGLLKQQMSVTEGSA